MNMLIVMSILLVIAILITSCQPMYQNNSNNNLYKASKSRNRKRRNYLENRNVVSNIKISSLRENNKFKNYMLLNEDNKV